MGAEVLLSCLKGVRKRGQGQWMACCPHHEDKSPSLSVRLLDDERILLHCFAGCSPAEVLGSVGLSMSDLFPEGAISHHIGKIPDWKRKKLESAKDHELLVLEIAAADKKKGKVISLADKKRERLAKLRVQRISEVLAHG